MLLLAVVLSVLRFLVAHVEMGFALVVFVRCVY